MFEKYTQEARRAVFFARREAAHSGHAFIAIEHLLLGIVHDEDTRIEQLFQLKQQLATIRAEVYRAHPKRKRISENQDLPLTNPCKRVLAYAAEEGEQLRDKAIDSEHLILGILRERDSIAATLLGTFGVHLEAAREIVRKKPVPGRTSHHSEPLIYVAPKESKWNIIGLVLIGALAGAVIVLLLRLR
ncbi:MAG: ATPase domain protein [Acidobacteriales bacterium]|nr:ATPase domain protein [Terriglobales bacterium]